MARSETAQPYLSLDEYRKLFNIPLCAFNGVENPDENRHACDHYWEQWERDHLAQALEDAEGMFANEMRFYFGERFLTDHDKIWSDPLQLRYGHVVGGGIRATTEVTPSASNFTIDPATITVATADFPGGTSEIRVEDDETGLEIEPDEVTTVGANYVISISQCKLIDMDILNAMEGNDPVEYDNTFPAATWLKLADLTVYREYLDTSSQATITYGPACVCWCSDGACTGSDYTGCVFVTDRKIGTVRVNRATYSDGWSCDHTAICGCYKGDKVTVHYRAGTDDIPNWKRAVYRLAHTLIEVDYCGCSIFKRTHRRDVRVPPILTAERINCRWGIMDGAWYAWQFMMTQQHGRAFMLG